MAKSFRETIGVPPSSASTADSTLLIIDAQNEYATGLLRTENVDSTRRAIAALLERYRAAGAAVVHIVHDTPEGAPVFTPGQDVSREFAELEPRQGEKVVHKSFPGSFTQTDLGAILEASGTKKVVLTGYMVSCLLYLSLLLTFAWRVGRRMLNEIFLKPGSCVRFDDGEAGR